MGFREKYSPQSVPLQRVNAVAMKCGVITLIN